MFEKLLGVLLILVFVLLVLQIVYFEFTKRMFDKSMGKTWYDVLEEPFRYKRTKRMIVLSVVSYVISSMGSTIDISYILYMVVFVAVCILSDIMVLYLVHIYAKIRCKKEIEDIFALQVQLDKIKESIEYDPSYIITNTLDEYTIYNDYIKSDSHVAYVNGDEGKYMSNLNIDAHVVYDVELNGNTREIEDRIGNDNIKVLSLASEERLPFKDQKIDVLINRDINYCSEETLRVLKDDGIFILKQYGESHLEEMRGVYSPIGVIIRWDDLLCSDALEREGWDVFESSVFYGNIRFPSIQSLYSYYIDTEKEFSNIEKYYQFYLKALSDIIQNGYFEMNTHEFIIFARKEKIMEM